MPRNPKIEVAAINLRISDDKERDYSALLVDIARLKKGIRVHGDTYLALNKYDPNDRLGVFSKYTEIDLDGDWFDVEDFDIADAMKIGKVSIPDGIRPNLSQFWFRLKEDLHIVVFETYSLSRALSARSVEKYFKEALAVGSIKEKYGLVEADIVKSFGEVDRLLALPDLKEIRITVRRPNTDDVGEDLAKVIEERLKRQKAREYEEILKTGSGEALDPDQRTKALANVAADNGEVRVKSLINGVLVPQDTSQSPLIEVDTHAPDGYDSILFEQLVESISSKIRAARESRRVE